MIIITINPSSAATLQYEVLSFISSDRSISFIACRLLRIIGWSVVRTPEAKWKKINIREHALESSKTFFPIFCGYATHTAHSILFQNNLNSHVWPNFVGHLHILDSPLLRWFFENKSSQILKIHRKCSFSSHLTLSIVQSSANLYKYSRRVHAWASSS